MSTRGLRPAVVIALAVGCLLASATGVRANPTVLPMGDPDDIADLGVDRLPTAISSDGRYVLWADEATRWGRRVPMITDRSTGEVVGLQSAFGSDVARPYDISDDGRCVLVSVVPADGSEYHFERLDRRTGHRRTVVVTPDRASARAYSLSSDGRYVGLLTESTGLYPRIVTLGRVDLVAGRLQVTEPFSGTVAESVTSSRDGRYSLFVEEHGTVKKAVRHDWETGERVDVGALNLPFRHLYTAISAQGRFVVWDGNLTDLDTSATVQFLDRLPDTATTVFVSGDGKKVAFGHSFPLSEGDADIQRDVFVWYRDLRIFRRASLSEHGTQATGSPWQFVMSADGSTIVFAAFGINAADRYRQSWWGGPLLVASLDAPLERGVVDASALETGYALLLGSGRVESRLDAVVHRSCVASKGEDPSTVTLRTDERATSLSPTPEGDGYWIFTSIGRVFACGEAQHFGDLEHFDLAGAVVDSVSTASGNGYYMAGADGGLFALGDATFQGSVPEVLPGVTLDAPIAAIAVTESGFGYRMVAADGGVFNFGDAVYFGSVPEVLSGVPLASPIVEMVASPAGYLMIGGDGGVFNFGESLFHGSLGDLNAPDPIRSIIVLDDLSGYVMFDGNGQAFPFGTGDEILR